MKIQLYKKYLSELFLFFRNHIDLCYIHAALFQKSASHVLKTDSLSDDPDADTPKISLF